LRGETPSALDSPQQWEEQPQDEPQQSGCSSILDELRTLLTKTTEDLAALRVVCEATAARADRILALAIERQDDEVAAGDDYADDYVDGADDAAGDGGAAPQVRPKEKALPVLSDAAVRHVLPPAVRLDSTLRPPVGLRVTERTRRTREAYQAIFEAFSVETTAEGTQLIRSIYHGGLPLSFRGRQPMHVVGSWTATPTQLAFMRLLYGGGWWAAQEMAEALMPDDVLDGRWLVWTALHPSSECRHQRLAIGRPGPYGGFAITEEGRQFCDALFPPPADV
jgi:hypothetical protein